MIKKKKDTDLQFHTNHVEEKLVSGEAPPQVTPEFCG